MRSFLLFSIMILAASGARGQDGEDGASQERLEPLIASPVAGRTLGARTPPVHDKRGTPNPDIDGAGGGAAASSGFPSEAEIAAGIPADIKSFSVTRYDVRTPEDGDALRYMPDSIAGGKNRAHGGLNFSGPRQLIAVAFRAPKKFSQGLCSTVDEDQVNPTDDRCQFTTWISRSPAGPPVSLKRARLRSGELANPVCVAQDHMRGGGISWSTKPGPGPCEIGGPGVYYCNFVPVWGRPGVAVSTWPAGVKHCGLTLGAPIGQTGRDERPEWWSNDTGGKPRPQTQNPQGRAPASTR